MAKRQLTGSFAAVDMGLDPEAANLDLKTKLSILKKALLSERKKTQDLESRIGILEATVQERDVKVRELQAEKTELESALYKEQVKGRDTGMSSPTNKAKITLELEAESYNQTLSQEFHSLKQQNVALDREIAELQQEVRELNSALESRDINMSRVLKGYEETQEQLQKQLKDSEQELTESRVEREELDQEVQRLGDESRAMKSKLAHAQDEIVALSAVKTDMQQVIDSLNESLITHAQNEALLAGKLMEMKCQLQEANSELRFEALKINKLINREAKIALRKDGAGIYIFEIDQKSRKKSYIASNIEDVCVDPENPGRFTIRLQVFVTQGEDMKVFESCEATKMVESIKRFLDRVVAK